VRPAPDSQANKAVTQLPAAKKIRMKPGTKSSDTRKTTPMRNHIKAGDSSMFAPQLLFFNTIRKKYLFHNSSVVSRGSSGLSERKARQIIGGP
jgi:hypothetical protein